MINPLFDTLSPLVARFALRQSVRVVLFAVLLMTGCTKSEEGLPMPVERTLLVYIAGYTMGLSVVIPIAAYSDLNAYYSTLWWSHATTGFLIEDLYE